MKTGDLVLVRSNSLAKWELSIYAYKTSFCGHPRHVCINGTEWAECIPLKGNEHLLGSRGTNPSGFADGQPVAVRQNEIEEWKVRYFFGIDKDEDGRIVYVCSRYPSAAARTESPLLDGIQEERWKICVPFENAFSGFSAAYERRDGMKKSGGENGQQS